MIFICYNALPEIFWTMKGKTLFSYSSESLQQEAEYESEESAITVDYIHVYQIAASRLAVSNNYSNKE